MMPRNIVAVVVKAALAIVKMAAFVISKLSNFAMTEKCVNVLLHHSLENVLSGSGFIRIWRKTSSYMKSSL